MEENSILPYVEPIFRFCCKRLGNRYDAEDLSGEIICHILEGMEKYEVKSLDAWVWRIAHNRYARFIDARNKTRMKRRPSRLLTAPAAIGMKRPPRTNSSRCSGIFTPFPANIGIFSSTIISGKCPSANCQEHIRCRKPPSSGA